MTDLRQAATLALDALTYIYTDTTADEDELIDQAITAIKEALAQPPLPVQEPFEYWNAVEGWVKIDEVREHFDAVNCGTIYKHGGEGRVPLYTAPPQREWVGLMEQDMPSGEDPIFDHQYFIAGLVYADKVLKEKNR